MSDTGSAGEMLDRVVDRILRGEDPDVEGLLADTQELAPDTRDALRKVARAFAPEKLEGAPVVLRDAAELPFAELGPYTLLSRMGEGGMGMVYAAEHRFLRRRVALKVIRPELAASAATRQRFQREAMRIASLRHENIVSVHDAGEHGGIAFLAMELVEGPGLDQLLRTARLAGERMDVTTAVRHARDIARALECAHAAGIIHRDVKPSNVRVTPDGRALLLDFGLALAEDATAISGAAQFRGTPQYASPEQIEAGVEELDPRTDVYSLGLTLYECLAGDVPFAHSGLAQLFHQILVRVPPDPREANERVDARLNEIVMRAIAKRREQRFASARELADALDAWLESAARRAPAAPRRTSSSRRRLAAAVVITSVGIAGFLLYDNRSTPAAAPRTAPTASDAGAVIPARPGAPVLASGARSSTALLGLVGQAFDQRLRQWEPLIGGGTFGADEDGPGVVGICVDGITAEPYALSRGATSVRGRVEPIAPSAGAYTLAAGAGIEFSDGRIVALLLVASPDGYDVRVWELLRDGPSLLTHGPELHARASSSHDGRPLSFQLAWSETDVLFEWSDGGAPAGTSSFLVPESVRGTARPSRFLLVVERGSARFDELVLEGS